MIVPVATGASSLVARTEAPTQVRADSVDVIDHYGVAPAAVGFAAVVARAVTLSTDTVSPVAAVVRSQAAPDGLGQFIDRFA
jgi:hypothetical protein